MRRKLEYAVRKMGETREPGAAAALKKRRDEEEAAANEDDPMGLGSLPRPGSASSLKKSTVTV